MTPTLILLNIIGGVCLLLYGLRQIRRGVMRSFGAGLRRFISACTRNRVFSLFSGMVGTLMLQSSSAVTMILATFTGQKMLTTAAALAVVLGADVGTALVAQVLTFDVSWLGPLILLIGFVLFSAFERHGVLKHVGLAIFGLGLMLFALGWIKMASLPFKESDALPYLLHPLEIDPVMTLIVAALMAWLFHSSLAFVLLVVSFAGAGLVSPHLALQLVLGANIGGVLVPLFATIRDEPTAVRLPFSNLVMRLIGALAALPFLNEFLVWVAPYESDVARQVVHFHLLFNVALAVVFLPLTGVVSRVVQFLIPDRLTADRTVHPLYLDDKQLETPVVALSSAARETLRMADVVQNMLERCREVFCKNNGALIRQIQDQDSVVDQLHRAIKHYMARAMELSLEPKEAKRHLQILDFATTLEHVGDLIDKSMMPMAERKIKNNRSFSAQGLAEIDDLFVRVIDSVRLAQTVFMSSDPALARQLVEGKERIRSAERLASANHFLRLKAGIPETVDSSSIHLDLIRDLQRINADVVTVAYPILEESGELLPHRLTKPRLSMTSLEPDLREEF